MKRIRGRWWVPLLAAVLAAGACGGEGEETEIEPAAEPGAMDGLTPEEIRAAAEPMSPAMAESLGIVDTTIHIESPYPALEDSLMRLRDTARVGADTARTGAVR